MLKKKNWFIILLLNIITLGLFNFVLAFKLNLYDEEAWYNKWQYWFCASLCLIFPVFIMFIVFLIQITVKVALKLKVDGADIYNSPYSWILCVIIPIVGWSLLFTMFIYLLVFISVVIKDGKGDIYA